MATNENLPPNVIKQLAKELKNLDETPPEGIKVGVNDDNFSVIYADIDGPAGTPYENGVFRMKLILSHDFPHSPPKGYFLTKIFHPNIATNGEICVNALKKDWNPTLGLRHVLIVGSPMRNRFSPKIDRAIMVVKMGSLATYRKKRNSISSSNKPERAQTTKSRKLRFWCACHKLWEDKFSRKYLMGLLDRGVILNVISVTFNKLNTYKK